MCGCVGDREALLDSVLSWQQSLWPDTGGRGKSVRAKEEGGKKGEEQVMSVRLGVSGHGEKRGEEKTV